MSKLDEAQLSTDAGWKTLVDAYNDKVGLLRAEHKKIKTSHEELNRRKQEQINHHHGTTEVHDNDLVDINAGGLPLTVTRGTLTQIKGSCLEALFSGRWEDKLVRDSNGRAFLDVNPNFFQSIVDYLYELKISPPDSPPPKPQCMNEQDQLCLDQLMETFGLNDLPDLDTKIIDDAPSHIRAVYDFLSEDEINGHLELLYRGSRDGFDASDFHSKCDNMGPTVTIIKDVGGYLFGGFVNASWEKGEKSTHCDKAFLFTLHCQSGLEPTKMRIRSSYTNHAICSASGHGPIFGSGHDIYVSSNCNTNNSSYVNFISYELPSGQNKETFLTGNGNFQVSEIEVFKVSNSKKRRRLSNHLVDHQHVLVDGSNQMDTVGQWQSNTFDEFPDWFKGKLMNEQKELLEAKEELKNLELAFEKEEELVDFFTSGDTKDIITFNVGENVLLETKRSTLGIFKDSVLAKQFCDPLWASTKDDDKAMPDNGVKGWDATKVFGWANGIDGLPSTEVAKVLKEQEVNGIKLLALEPVFLEKMGITMPATQALIMKEIRELQKFENIRGATLVEHSAFCFGKVLDHLRLCSFCKAHNHPMPSPPIVNEFDRKRFKSILEYYFPNDIASFISSD